MLNIESISGRELGDVTKEIKIEQYAVPNIKAAKHQEANTHRIVIPL